MKLSLETLFRSVRNAFRPRTAGKASRTRLALEELETRLVPAAHTYTVTTVLDNDVAHAGLTSLRDAVTAADANADPGDVINFSGALAGKTILLKQGELDITATVRVQGLGAGLLAISGGNNSRIFNLDSGGSGASLTVRGLTLTKGDFSTTGDEEDGGGAIAVHGSTDSLTVQNCVFTQNTSGSTGGAIADYGSSLTIQGSVFDHNVSGLEGGAIVFHPDDSNAKFLLATSAISNNTVTSGEQGGGVALENGGKSATINSCTFSGNVTGGEGGAIALRSAATTTIQNTTIYGNTSGEDGGGIWNVNTTLTARNDTIAGNKSTDGEGGGIYTTDATTNIFNTIVSGNKEFSESSANHLHANDISSGGGEESPSTYNVQYSLIQAVTAGTINGTKSHNIIGVDPNLGPLQYNGGPYFLKTLKPKAGSIVLGHGSVSLLASLTLDERGFPRTYNGTVDMGAVEASYDYSLLVAAGRGSGR